MEAPGTTRVILRRVALRVLLVAAAAAGFMLLSSDGRQLVRDPLEAAGLFLFAVILGASCAPLAWVEVGAMLRGEPAPSLRLALASLATSALGPSVLAQLVWSVTLIDTRSAEEAWAAVAALPDGLSTERDLAVGLVFVSVGWPFLLLFVSASRLGSVGRGGRLLLHLLFFPSSLVLLGLAGAADALDGRVFGPPPALEPAPPAPTPAAGA